jgi:hypothetical protein
MLSSAAAAGSLMPDVAVTLAACWKTALRTIAMATATSSGHGGVQHPFPGAGRGSRRDLALAGEPVCTRTSAAPVDGTYARERQLVRS